MEHKTLIPAMVDVTANRYGPNTCSSLHPWQKPMYIHCPLLPTLVMSDIVVHRIPCIKEYHGLNVLSRPFGSLELAAPSSQLAVPKYGLRAGRSPFRLSECLHQEFVEEWVVGSEFVSGVDVIVDLVLLVDLLVVGIEERLDTFCPVHV